MKTPAGLPTANDFSIHIENLKKQARSHLQDNTESLRIAWQHRWKRPLHHDFKDYTMEELIIELHEQFYLENPDAIESQGIYKKKNPKTGITYYETGDPVLDELEREFGEGRVPDMNKVFQHIDTGKDIFHDMIPKPVVQTEDKSETIHQADHFKTDDWISDAKKDDPFIQKMEDFVRGK